MYLSLPLRFIYTRREEDARNAFHVLVSPLLSVFPLFFTRTRANAEYKTRASETREKLTRIVKSSSCA